MHTGRKILAVFNILAVLSILGNALVFAVDQVTGQLIYDYVADPAVIVAIFLTVLVNLGDSLRKREGFGVQPGTAAAGCHYCISRHVGFPLPPAIH